ncbi:probable disease resistance RPP8-like protein 4 [Salvia miltiorrhiza]|uniref:probable disease resistance RPP8-like protein 4 n=1 Tax=Salvia miltiorrhiza TaxID=226208 RepID=UPI0025ACD66A|nr:probable disease resistance RPP8-like protein 4 [Salvia miltiorrhiza]
MDKLRYFSAHFAVGLTNITTWKNIECLRHVSHEYWMKCRSTLTSSCNLRELGIRFYDPIEHQGLIKVRASLEKLQNLIILHLTMSLYCVTDLAIAVPQLTNLTKLKLKGKMPKCPTASMFPPNLSHLTLIGSELHDDPMAELGKLPKLLFLKIQNNGYCSETMVVLCHGFPCLESLSFGNLHGLKGVFIEEGGMPKLKHLRIHDCFNLKTWNLPQHINIYVIE